MTKRAVYILTLIVASYFVANLNGFGWLFGVCALLVGLFCVSIFVPGLMVHGLIFRRTFAVVPREAGGTGRSLSATPGQPVRVFAGERLRTTAIVTNTGWVGRYLVRIMERHPLGPPQVQIAPRVLTSKNAKVVASGALVVTAPPPTALFVMGVGGGQSVHIEYDTDVYLRGIYTMTAPQVVSSAPAGLFTARRILPTPPVTFWVLPDYVEVEQLPLPPPDTLAMEAQARVGPGTDIYGTRDYRPGDSLRQIHWRSTARTSRLVIKEFEQVMSAPVTILLDRHALAQMGAATGSTFETAVRLAASIAACTTRTGHPTLLAGDGTYPFPTTPLGLPAILDHLAHANADGTTPLPDLIAAAAPAATLFVLATLPAPFVIEALLTRQKRTGGRSQLVVILFDTPSFDPPSGAPVTDARLPGWVETLRDAGVLTALCRKDDPLSDVLESLDSQSHTATPYARK